MTLHIQISFWPPNLGHVLPVPSSFPSFFNNTLSFQIPQLLNFKFTNLFINTVNFFNLISYELLYFFTVNLWCLFFRLQTSSTVPLFRLHFLLFITWYFSTEFTNKSWLNAYPTHFPRKFLSSPSYLKYFTTCLLLYFL